MAGRSVRARKGSSVWKPNTEALKDKQINVPRGKFLTVPVGITKLRVLPPGDYLTNPDAIPLFDAALHYGFKDGTRRRALPCLRYHGDGKADCPTCIMLDWVKANGKPAQQDLIVDNMDIRPQTYANVLNRDDDFPTVRVWRMSSVMRDNLDTMNKAECDEAMYDPERGYDILLTRVGTGQYDTRYSATVAHLPSPVKMKDWDKKVYNLEKEILIEVTPEEMRSYIMAQFDGILPLDKIFGKTKKTKKTRKKK